MLDTQKYLSDEEIVTIITKGITDGKAQNACIWEIIRLEKGAYGIDDNTQKRDEWNTRYHEIDAFIDKKGLRIPEIWPFVEGFKKDVSRLLRTA